MELYPLLGSTTNQTKHRHTFPSGARINFTHLATSKDVYNYQGGEIALLQFDEITHFKESEVFYLISRNRSTSGVRPYVRGTCNPDPDSWVRKFIDWWIDEDGYAIPERSGVLRYFARVADTFVWGDSREELASQYGLEPQEVMSFTFILSRLKDNPALTEQDPSYQAKLKALPKVERERLLGDPERGGNWNVRAVKGTLFKRDYFEIIDDVPALVRYVRIWDLAGTAPHPGNRDPDYTVGLKLGLTESGLLVILDCYYARVGSLEVETAFKTRALQDGRLQLVEQEGGQSGKAQITHLQRLVPGVEVRGFTLSGNKDTEEGQRLRYGPTSAKAEAGLIKMLRGPWNDFVFAWLEALAPGVAHDDVPDCLTAGHNELLLGAKGQKRRRSRTR